MFEDSREEHRSDPPTQWFIAETNKGRLLKISCIYKNGRIYLKTALEAKRVDIELYEQLLESNDGQD